MNTAPTFREIRYKEKRRKILDNAARIFARKGYEKSSLKEIADKLQLSKASLYHYVKSKEEMLYLIQLDAIEEAIENLERVCNSDMNPEQKLHQAVISHVKVVTKRHVVGALRQQELILPKKWRDKIVSERDLLEKQFHIIIQEGVERGLFIAKDVRISELSILGILNGIIRWYSPQGRLSVAEIGEAVADFIMRGFGVDLPKAENEVKLSL